MPAPTWYGAGQLTSCPSANPAVLPAHQARPRSALSDANGGLRSSSKNAVLGFKDSLLGFKDGLLRFEDGLLAFQVGVATGFLLGFGSKRRKRTALIIDE